MISCYEQMQFVILISRMQALKIYLKADAKLMHVQSARYMFAGCSPAIPKVKYSLF